MNSNDDPDFGLASGELRLVAVGPEWASRFAVERGRLTSALGARLLDVQHIGSTAIPGILAKPILDIAAAIPAFEDGLALVPLLVDLGYEYRGENGIPRRHYFVRGSPRRTHHLHVFERHSAEWAHHLRFRDTLLASPATAARYSELKRSIVAQAGCSRDRYQGLKASFIVGIHGLRVGA